MENADESDVITMEPVVSEPHGIRAPGVARVVFLTLAGIAAVALAVAIFAIVVAPDSAVTLLVSSLVVLAIVVVAEIVLLLVARPRNA